MDLMMDWCVVARWAMPGLSGLAEGVCFIHCSLFEARTEANKTHLTVL
jgi:hypothetical protein